MNTKIDWTEDRITTVFESVSGTVASLSSHGYSFIYIRNFTDF